MRGQIELAEAIKATARWREESYNGRSYDYSISEAAGAACMDRAQAQLVGLLLIACWNDALDWAEEFDR